MSGLIPSYCNMFDTDRICWRTLQQVSFISGIIASSFSQDFFHMCHYFNWESGFALLLLAQWKTRKPTWLAGKVDAFPIQNDDFPLPCFFLVELFDTFFLSHFCHCFKSDMWKPGSHRMSWDAPLPSKSGKWRFLPPSKIDIDPPKIAIFRAGDYFFHTSSHHFGYPFVNLCGASWLGKHGWSIWEASHGSVENSTWRAVAMATWCFHRPRRLSNEKRVPRCLRYGI